MDTSCFSKIPLGRCGISQQGGLRDAHLSAHRRSGCRVRLGWAREDSGRLSRSSEATPGGGPATTAALGEGGGIASPLPRRLGIRRIIRGETS